MDYEKLYQKLSDNLIGRQIRFGSRNYGKVIEIEWNQTHGNTLFFAVTNKRKKVNAIQLYELLRKVKGTASEKQYPEGTTFSKYNAGMKAKRIAKAVQMTTPNTIAKIDEEEINISSHLTSERGSHE